MSVKPLRADSAERRRKPTLCPSSRCAEGAILLGVVGSDAQVQFLNQPVRIDAEFVDIAHQGRRPEKRFRFSSPCATNACRHWTGSRCGVIDEVFDSVPETHRIETRPRCAIREQCRWHRQEGDAACGACPLVITDLMVDG